ncbi:hypothetical protein ACFLTE_05020 [Bacteroidota bacterium]
MKKIALILCGAFIYLASYGQAVNDKAVIPVSVNLNQILRLNIVSGGNIEFTFNTITDYTGGLTGTQYQTTFNVTSSVIYDVNFYSESANMQGNDDAANTIASGFVALSVTDNAGGATVDATWQLLDDIVGIGNQATLIDASPAGAATAAANQWVVSWECATANTDGSLLGQPADRYSVNTFIVVSGN